MKNLWSAILTSAVLLTACTGPSVQPPSAGRDTSAVAEQQPAAAVQSNPQSQRPIQAPPASGATVVEGDIRKVAEAWAAATSYRAKMQMTLQGETTEMLQEVVRPNRERMKMTARGQDIEIVHIGADTYTNFSGQWIKASRQGVPTAAGVDPSEMVRQFNEGIDKGNRITKGGLGLVDGAPCQEWINDAADPKEAGTMCIGLLDNLPRGFTAADGSLRMTFSDWNASITINPPM